MKKKNDGNIGIVFLVALTMVVIATAIITLDYEQEAEPTIDISSSLTPNPISETEKATLTLSVENLDLSTHQIKFEFEINSFLTIHAGASESLNDNSYTFTLDASDPHEDRIFTVSGSVGEKTTSSNYVISVNVYVDGIQVPEEKQEIEITVQA